MAGAEKRVCPPVDWSHDAQRSDFRTFGQLVAELRQAQKLTQDDLGALMGFSQSSGRVLIANWERGARVPTEQQLRKLAACLGYWRIEGDGSLRREIVQRALAGALRG
jgi:transcriptional regulator with XRE-family HTH domain